VGDGGISGSISENKAAASAAKKHRKSKWQQWQKRGVNGAWQHQRVTRKRHQQ
jgi:hypothetical protein